MPKNLSNDEATAFDELVEVLRQRGVQLGHADDGEPLLADVLAAATDRCEMTITKRRAGFLGLLLFAVAFLAGATVTTGRYEIVVTDKEIMRLNSATGNAWLYHSAGPYSSSGWTLIRE